MSNAQIADRLASLAQLLSAGKENPYKIKAYMRASARIRALADSLDELVHEDADLTRYPGIGDAIAGAIREIVFTGTLGKLEALRAEAPPALASISDFPRLDPKRVARVYKKLGIASVDELRAGLESGNIEKAFGQRMTQHIRQGLTETHAMLLYRADDLRLAVEEFLLNVCKVRRAEAAGDYRRRVEVIEELVFVIEAEDFAGVVSRLQRYGGHTPLLSSAQHHAEFALSSGIRLSLQCATEKTRGLRLLACTGSEGHLKKLAKKTGSLRKLEATGEAFPEESGLYARFGLHYIEPELREGRDEVARAASGSLPVLVKAADIRGELHAHSTSSDGNNSIEEMAAAAKELGYEYIGITDHSMSLKIAGGVSVEDLWAQIRYIDKLNAKFRDFRILKSSEVDILADGSLDYSDELLRELDYTVCSVHSRFGLDRSTQTERLMRAMDNRYFNILGHATGRLLLKRPGYEIDLGRIIGHARQTGCFFEINSSPDRLDLSAENTRAAWEAGVMIAINTDGHSIRDFRYLPYGIDQARRAGLAKSAVLNCQPCDELQRLFRR
jgi:DNA polymerase (family 10)